LGLEGPDQIGELGLSRFHLCEQRRLDPELIEPASGFLGNPLAVGLTIVDDGDIRARPLFCDAIADHGALQVVAATGAEGVA
jgi:hypothetical protein